MDVIVFFAVPAITLVVWSVMTVESPHLRAFLYSLPIPISIALLDGPASAPGGQYAGVVFLVGFTYAIAILGPKFGRLGGVALAVLGYLGAAMGMHRWLPLPSFASFAVASIILGGLGAWAWAHAAPSSPPRPAIKLDLDCSSTRSCRS